MQGLPQPRRPKPFSTFFSQVETANYYWLVACMLAPCRHARKMARRRRTNILMVAVSVIFFTAWLPLNVLNVSMDWIDLSIETEEVTPDT